jgi:hypothetical protein
MGRRRSVKRLRQNQAARLLKPQLFLVLEWTHGRYSLEVLIVASN